MKKLNKKGFTLIELLAIIVILAIIAVITVPIILNIIENARKGAAKNSVIGYGKAVELAYTQYQYEKELPSGNGNKYETTTVGTDGKAIKLTIQSAGTSVGTLNLVVEFDGDKVVCDNDYANNTINDGKVHLKNCVVNDNQAYKFDYESGQAK